MSNCHNDDLGRLESVHDLVRKPSYQRAARLAVGRDRHSDFRVRFNKCEECADLVEELTAEARAPGFVPADRLAEFVGGWLTRADRPRHRPRISRSIRRFTSPQGSNLTVPASIAATRRSISAAHAASAAGSAGPSRLAKSSAATSARASRSRRKASARTASAAFVMSPILRSDSPPNKRLQPSGQVSQDGPRLKRETLCRLNGSRAGNHHVN